MNANPLVCQFVRPSARLSQLVNHSISSYHSGINIDLNKIEISWTISPSVNRIWPMDYPCRGLIMRKWWQCCDRINAWLRKIAIILNSPFLDFNQTRVEKLMSYFVAKIMSKISVYSKINGMISPVYGHSIHKDFYGEWDYNQDWKPIKGFPTYFKWW